MFRHVQGNCNKRDDDPPSDGGGLRDILSLVSEGSNPDSSLSSIYFSCVSAQNAQNKGRGSNIIHLADLAQRRSSSGTGGGSSSSTTAPHPVGVSIGTKEGRSSDSTTKTDNGKVPSPAHVKKAVKKFVEQGVRGRDISLMRRDGSYIDGIFKLSRQVDFFEIVTAGKMCEVMTHRIEVTDIGAAATGGTSVIIELVDGRVLTIDLATGPTAKDAFREAENWGLCLQMFAEEASKRRRH